MIGFYGQFKVNLDPKGRLALPAKIRPREQDGSSSKLVLTKGLDGCLALYTEKEWSSFQERLNELSFTTRDFRFVSRMIYSAASVVEPDRQGRFLIPGHLLEDAGLKSDALVLGAYRWIEIWNPERFDKHVDKHGATLEDVADRLFSDERSGKD